MRTANNTSEVARITVDCGNGVITNVNLRTNGRNEGTLEGDNGTTCDPDQVNVEFDCQPGSGDAVSIRAQFDEAQGEAVCLNPVLAVDFVVELDDGTTETIDNLEASAAPTPRAATAAAAKAAVVRTTGPRPRAASTAARVARRSRRTRPEWPARSPARR